MAYTKYSLTPANNTAAPPDGAPEGMLPSAVNDTMRDMMAQIRDCGDGIRDGTYTMTAPKITGGSITGVALTGNTLTNPVVSGGTITNATITGGSVSSVTFSSSAATITGGSVSGITDLTIADGGTGASTAANARVNLGVDNYGMLKNRIINGAMVIDQRNAGALVNPAVSGTYYLDRFIVGSSVAGKFSIGQNAGSVTPPVGFKNYLGTTSLSAYTPLTNESFTIQQRIEGYNVADLGWGTANAKTVTLSFWVYSSLTGTFGGNLRNSPASRYYPYSYTISAANTWEYKTITVAGDTSGTWATDNTAGLNVQWALGAGPTITGTAGSWGSTAYATATGATSVVGTNGATFYLTGCQLEVGTQATSFDYRPYGTELALCQRYYYKVKGSGTGASTFGLAYIGSTTQAQGFVQFPVTMRDRPTALEQSGTAADYIIAHGGTASTCSAVPTYNTTTTKESALAIFTVASGLTVGQAGRISGATDNANTYLAWSAEL